MSSLRFRVGQGLCLALLASFVAHAGPVPTNGKPESYPNWWFERDVIPRLPDFSTTVPPILTWPTHYPLSDDYAAANIGQLKLVAIKAADEMSTRLPFPGAGSAISTMLASWNSSSSRDDYAVVNLGQLKAVSIPFYDRLYDMGVRSPSGHKYPWQGSPNPPDDFALVNLGQMKHVFGFRVPGGSDAAADTDDDGLFDAWELLHFGNLVRDGSGDWNNDGLLDRDAFRFGLNPKGDDESEVAGKFDVFFYDARGWLGGMILTGNASVSFGLDDEGNIETAN